MTIPSPIALTSNRVLLEASPNRLGQLRSSADLVGSPHRLRARAEEDGYLFIPGFFDPGEVLGARLSVLAALRDEGVLHPDRDWRDAVARPGVEMAFRADLANGNPVIHKLLYSDRMMAFYADLFDEPARHYDYTWLRAVAPGFSTEPHYDIVYMGRGSKRIYTAWVPMSHITYDVGGLMILENSHQLEDLKATYGTMDVDEICENHDDVRRMNLLGYHGYGALSGNPRDLAEGYDRRWLTAEFSLGDLLTFSMFTLHASTDNRSDQIRISTDSRYQPAAEPADERWIGEHPLGHGGKATRKLIC